MLDCRDNIDTKNATGRSWSSQGCDTCGRGHKPLLNTLSSVTDGPVLTQVGQRKVAEDVHQRDDRYISNERSSKSVVSLHLQRLLTAC